MAETRVLWPLDGAPREPSRYARAVEQEVVRVSTVPGEAEAESLCGLLRANGIKCAYRPTLEADSPFENFSSSGGIQEILVAPEDLETARELLREE